MGIFSFAVINDISTSVSIRALLGGLFVMLVTLPLLAVIKTQKNTRQILFIVLLSVIMLCSSVIVAASIAHINNEPRLSIVGAIR